MGHGRKGIVYIYAIIHALKVFHSYVYGQKVTVFSDHKPLEWIMSKASLTGRFCRWSLYLQQFYIAVKYRPGKANQNADTLSRIPVQAKSSTDTASILIISNAASSSPSKEEFILAQAKDDFCNQLLEKKGADVVTREKLITLNGRIVVPSLSLRSRVIERFRDHKFAGHLGNAKTIGHIVARHFWPQMRKDIKEYIRTFLKCVMGNHMEVGLLRCSLLNRQRLRGNV